VSHYQLGYTELRTNLPGGRHANVRTMRAVVVNADGSARRVLAEGLARDPNTWTQFAGWSPDGKIAVLGQGWQGPENAKWEEEHRQFRSRRKVGDMIATSWTWRRQGRQRDSHRPGQFLQQRPVLLAQRFDQARFTALIDGNSQPFRMDRDGRNKVS